MVPSIKLSSTAVRIARRLQAGEQLIDEQWADELNVTRETITNALARLESYGAISFDALRSGPQTQPQVRTVTVNQGSWVWAALESLEEGQ